VRTRQWEAAAALIALSAWALIAIVADNPAGHGFGAGYVAGVVLAVAALLATLARLGPPMPGATGARAAT
jgi:hypothetical protein